MKRSTHSDLDFDNVIELVAAHARTRVSRRFLAGDHLLPTVEHGARQARLTLEVEELLAEDGPLSFSGVDDALVWLQPEVPPAREIQDLMCLLSLARRVASLRRRLAKAPGSMDVLHQLRDGLPDTSGLVAWAGSKLGRDGQIPDQATPELARLRRRLIQLRRDLLQQLEVVQKRHGEVVTDAPPTLRRDRYCIPVRASARGSMDGLVLDSSGSGATVFMEPYSAVELNNALVDTSAREAEEIRRIVDEVAAAFAGVRDELVGAVEVIGILDAAQARVLFGRAAAGRVVMPGDGAELILRRVRHPLLDDRLEPLRREVFRDPERRHRDRGAVPLDLRLPEGNQTLVISGPNAGGKTVVLKTVGLMVLMAYHGIPLPVDQGTTMPAFDHLWCHIGDEQSVAADLSTFSGAMASTASLLRVATERSLVLFDELGAGTDPLEGAALGIALLEELNHRGSVTIASTHLATIALSAGGTEGMVNAAMEYDEDAGRPTYQLRFGRPGRSHALEIAASVGVDEAIVNRARELLGGDHLELDAWLGRLEQVEAELLGERTDVHRLQQEITRRLRDLEAEQQRLGDERRRLPDVLTEERERLRRRAKERLDRAIQTLEEATRDLKPLGRRRLQQVRQQALDLPLIDEDRQPSTSSLEPGARVRLSGLGGEGDLVELRGNQALVALSGKRLWIDAGDLQQVAPGPAPSPKATVRVEAEESTPGELNILGMDCEGGREELEQFLDRALVAGRTVVRVVHGHGTGALRRMVRDVCSFHPAVRSFRHPPQQFGGTGATEVRLEGDGSG